MYNPDSAARMQADLDRYMEELAAKKKAQKEEQQSIEVQKIINEFTPLHEEFKKYIESHREANRYGGYGTWLPTQFYGYKMHVEKSIKQIEKYSRKSTMIKKYQELIAFMNQVMGS